MAAAGAAWAVYTLAGRSSREPVAANARNFLWSSPLALLVVLAAPGAITASPRGILLALVSGGVTSGLGYIALVSGAAAPVGDAGGGGAGRRADHRRRRRCRTARRAADACVCSLAGAAVLGGIGLLLSRRLRAATS